MRARGLRVPGLLLLLVALPPAASAAQDRIGIARGSTPDAPTLEDLDGGPVDLADWVGRTPVVFQFWATWCPLCKALEPEIAAAREAHGDDVAFVVIAVGVNQSVRSVRRYVERHQLTAPVLWDGKGAAVRAFEAPGTAYVVALDRSGVVVYTGLGADQDIAGAFAAALR